MTRLPTMVRSALARSLVVSLVALGSLPGAASCTIFAVATDEGPLMGNNEDFTKPGVIWFVPGKKGRLGRVNVGFEFDFAQGSMNEAGLAFDAAALSEVRWKADPAKETSRKLIEKIMNECSSVEEALDYFRRFNFPYLAHSQFFFADAKGDAALVAWLPDTGLSISRSEEGRLITTNTRLERYTYRDQRFVRVQQVLQEHGEPSVEGVSRALDAVHQRGPGGFTSYSTVYDLERRKLYLYNLAHFGEVVEFDLRAELAKGRKRYKMKTLFESSPTLDEIRAGEQRLSFGTRVTLTEDRLARYAGVYAPESAPTQRIEVRVDGENLRVVNPGQPDAILFPESERLFRIAPDRGQVSFGVDAEGRVRGLTLHKAQDVYAKRIQTPG